MALKIAQLGQPILRQVAAAVSKDEIASAEFQQLVEQMLETLNQEHGAGLAGPQVFAGKRVFLAVIEPPRDKESPLKYEVFVNPRLVGASAETASAWEGCLSFPELLVRVPRYRGVRVEYLNRHGEPHARELYEFPARVVQHELDHLDGILTLDRAESTKDIIKASEIDAVEEATHEGTRRDTKEEKGE